MHARSILTTLVCLCAITCGYCQPSVAWEGLVGLFTQPTAETLPQGSVAVTYSEVRFSQESGTNEVENTWFTGTVTAVPFPRWEVSLTNRHDVVDYYRASEAVPDLEIDDVHLLGSVKYVFTPPVGNHIGLAVGVQDITDATDEIDGADIGQGRRFFAVGSYHWAHLGVTDDNRGVGVYAGAQLPVMDSIDLIAEYVTRPSFVSVEPEPENKVNFNLGARIHPQDVPNLQIDVAAVGDGEFNLGFSFSYLFRP